MIKGKCQDKAMVVLTVEIEKYGDQLPVWY